MTLHFKGEQMVELSLTRESIQADILSFEERLDKAKQHLVSLPTTAPNWQARKKIGFTRNKLLTEIDHIKRIRQYAIDSLAEFAEG
jgi:hypothetical protein